MPSRSNERSTASRLVLFGQQATAGRRCRPWGHRRGSQSWPGFCPSGEISTTSGNEPSLLSRAAACSFCLVCSDESWFFLLRGKSKRASTRLDFAQTAQTAGLSSTSCLSIMQGLHQSEPEKTAMHRLVGGLGLLPAPCRQVAGSRPAVGGRGSGGLLGQSRAGGGQAPTQRQKRIAGLRSIGGGE